MTKCLMCGKEIFAENLKKDPYDDEECERKSPSFCQKCLAKVKYESGESQKVPKPM